MFTSEYGRRAAQVYKLIKASTTNPLPLLSVCLGFQMVLYFEAAKKNLIRCKARNTADTLIMVDGGYSARQKCSYKNILIKTKCLMNNCTICLKIIYFNFFLNF